MAKDALTVGSCHSETAYKRYRLPRHVRVPWDSPPTTTQPFHIHPDTDDDASDPEDAGLPLEDDLPFLPPVIGLFDQIAQDAPDPGQVDDDDSDADAADAAVDAAVANTLQALDSTVFTDSAGETDNSSDAASEDTAELGDDTDDDDPRLPKIAVYRVNLTALSQRYNIYAVAYRDKIHISRVRSCINHTLPPRPDMILRPSASRAAMAVGGQIDRDFPHQVNHLVMGDLGEKEILLMAYDDGDVIGYYADQIESALERLDSTNVHHPQRTTISPFFHENTGSSAWGLAVHKRSRLIAVGNNARQVHVFYFGGYNFNDPQLGTHNGLSLFIRSIKSADTEPNVYGSGFPHLSWQIVHLLGPRGNNIPNLAFSNDTDGLAAQVIAIDITGKLWSIDIRPNRHSIWHVDSVYARRPPPPQPLTVPHLPPPPFGWGVLVLPESSFLPTDTFKDSLGLSPEKAEFVYNNTIGYYIDNESSIELLGNNSRDHPWVRSHQRHRFVQGASQQVRRWYDKGKDRKEGWSAPGNFTTSPSHSYSQGKLSGKDTKSGTEKKRLRLEDGSSVMRTYEMDIELYGGDGDNVGIMLQNAILQKRPRGRTLPLLGWKPERLSNLVHVPELSLVVAASWCGRVALVTLTRPKSPKYSFRRGFRVETILPTAKDEDHHLRPICPLLGVAIGPIPSTGKDNGCIGERRYRLMLHYYNLKILSYEVYRSAETMELFVA